VPAPFFTLEWPETGLLLAGLSFLFLLTMLLFPRPLDTREAKRGILSLELAWTPANARRILDSWRRAGMLGRAKRNVQWDFAFIPSYAAFAAVVGVVAARGAAEAGFLDTSTARDTASAVAWAMIFAGALDLGENLALFSVLDAAQRREDPPAAAVTAASTLATAKLLLLACGLVLTLVLGVCSLLVWAF
jgi:hypothetical protein